MTSAIRQRLDEARQQRRVQAGSLIITVFGDTVLPHGGRIWLGSLIRLVAPLELNERLVRTTVFRLAREEWLRAEAVGRRSDYVLTEAGHRRFEEASRHIYASQAPLWDRRWRLILLVGEVPARVRERLRRALAWQGYGALGSDCFVHPGADLTATLDALVAEGCGDCIPHLMPLLAADSRSELSASNADLVRRAWNLEQLAAAYGDFVRRYLPILAELRRERQTALDEEEAFLVRILLIQDYRRLLLRDPELPDVLLPADWPGQKARLLCKDLYRRLAGPSERHLERHLRLADDGFPPLDPDFADRFPSEDPLAAIAM